MLTAEIKIRKIGNSRGVIIPSDFLEAIMATEIGTRLIISADPKKGLNLSVKPSSDESFVGPFKALEQYAHAWDNDSSAVEMAEELKLDRINKEIVEW